MRPRIVAVGLALQAENQTFRQFTQGKPIAPVSSSPSGGPWQRAGEGGAHQATPL